MEFPREAGSSEEEEWEEEVQVGNQRTRDGKQQPPVKKKNQYGGLDWNSTMPGTSDSLTLDRIVLNTCESIFSSFLRGTASTFRRKFSRLIPGATVSHAAIKLSALLQRIQTPLFREDMCCSLRLPGDRHTRLKVFWRFKPNQDASNDLILVVRPHMTPFNVCANGKENAYSSDQVCLIRSTFNNTRA